MEKRERRRGSFSTINVVDDDDYACRSFPLIYSTGLFLTTEWVLLVSYVRFPLVASAHEPSDNKKLLEAYGGYVSHENIELTSVISLFLPKHLEICFSQQSGEKRKNIKI